MFQFSTTGQEGHENVYVFVRNMGVHECITSKQTIFSLVTELVTCILNLSFAHSSFSIIVTNGLW